MEYLVPEGTDLSLSRLGFGSMPFGSRVDQSTADRMVDLCLDAGVNLFDTSNSYNRGESERMLGRALGARRSDVVIASKVFYPVGDGIDTGGLQPAGIRQALENSLERLGTDYLDIYFLHAPDRAVPIADTMDVLEEARAAGKIRYIGFSNFPAWRFAEVRAQERFRKWPKVVLAEVVYNLLSRGVEGEFADLADHFGLSTLAFNPLAGGLLSGRYGRTSAVPSEGRFAGEAGAMYRDRYWGEAQLAAVAALARIADDAGLTLIELSYRWLLSRPLTSSILIGAASVEHLEDNLRAPGPVDVATLAACDEVWSALAGVVEPYYR